MIGGVWVTAHVRERLREHHPFIGTRGARAMFERSTEISREVAAGLLCRQMSAVQDRYYLAEDRRGLFVLLERPHHVRPDETWRSLVTYIRFGPAQVEVATRLYAPSLLESAA